MAVTPTSNWFKATIAITVAVISASTALTIYVFKKKSKELNTRIKELENSLKFSEKKCNAERQGRIRAQQAVRKALTDDNSGKSKQTSYPMAPIGVVQSCFSTRNGTPRQPLLVPLARACLVFDTSQVPLAALEGLTQYSHCWIIYVFHLNTNLDKLWKLPSKSRFKAKVRVPRLKGGRMGVFATRSPHRPCPIGLTVAKVAAVQGNMVLLSGVDLVNGTPVLDIKPYLPFCDSIQEAKVPDWITGDNLAVTSVNFTEEFSSTLANCWVTTGNKSLYASSTELQSLIKQVLSWDVRSLSQHKKPHNSVVKEDSQSEGHHVSDLEDDMDEDVSTLGTEQDPVSSPEAVTYYLLLEGLDVAYRIDRDGNVFVEKAALSSDVRNKSRYSCNYTMWRDVLG